MSHFQENMIQARKSKQWSQEGAASAIGIKRARLGAWEEGRSFPRPDVIKKICQTYGVPKDRLYDFLFAKYY